TGQGSAGGGGRAVHCKKHIWTSCEVLSTWISQLPCAEAVTENQTLCFYGLVFDAGSTHTSLYTYRWRADKENGTGIVSQVEACSVSGECWALPSLSMASLGAALHGVCAFAGREQNSSKAQQVLAEVSKAIGEYPVDFRGARILTGSEEGSFGWITVNYLLETLVKVQSTWKKWEHPQDTEVLGALDLGGASTQITFQPRVPVEDRNTSVFFRLYGTNYSLYSHSYLCYGQSQALKMLLAALHQASSGGQIKHPCYPQGYQENITVAELYDSPCVRAPSSASPGLVLTVTGTGDPAACDTAVRRLFNFSCGAQGPCGFNGVYQPPVRGQFLVSSLRALPGEGEGRAWVSALPLIVERAGERGTLGAGSICKPLVCSEVASASCHVPAFLREMGRACLREPV
uniref:Ectonucleoside triphosphate diphosphohydrolase 8 n=1 Tax=Zonotrichia albicollis TaxID=44394 RepID=A0A8D2MWI8_ZONAL